MIRLFSLTVLILTSFIINANETNQEACDLQSFKESFEGLEDEYYESLQSIAGTESNQEITIAGTEDKKEDGWNNDSDSIDWADEQPEQDKTDTTTKTKKLIEDIKFHGLHSINLVKHSVELFKEDYCPKLCELRNNAACDFIAMCLDSVLGKDGTCTSAVSGSKAAIGTFCECGS